MSNHKAIFDIRLKRAKLELERVTIDLSNVASLKIEDVEDGDVESLLISAETLKSEIEQIKSAFRYHRIHAEKE